MLLLKVFCVFDAIRLCLDAICCVFDKLTASFLLSTLAFYIGILALYSLQRVGLYFVPACSDSMTRVGVLVKT